MGNDKKYLIYNRGGVVNMLRNVYFNDTNYMEYAIAYERIGSFYFLRLVARDMRVEHQNRMVHYVPLPDLTISEAIELYFRMNNLSIKK